MADTPEYRTEREEARERLKQSIDALTERANLQVQLQKDPLKMLGGASAVGALIGVVMGRQLRRSKKIYVDAASPVRHQKALVKAQAKQQGGRGVGGALIATLGTLAVKTLTERVITPKLEELSSSLLEKAGQAPARASGGASSFEAPARTPTPAARPAAAQGSAPSSPAPTTPTASAPASSPAVSPALQAHAGVRPLPASRVEAKAVGTEIPLEEKVNPNLR